MLTPEKVNAWRIIPRLAVLLFFILWIISTRWFIGLSEPNNAQSMFISTVWGSSAAFFGFYMNTGKK